MCITSYKKALKLKKRAIRNVLFGNYSLSDFTNFSLYFSCVCFLWSRHSDLESFFSNCFSESSDNYKHEKEDMINKSENNSIAWSSEDDVPPQIIIQNSNSSKKLEPLLQPLKYKSPTKE